VRGSLVLTLVLALLAAVVVFCARSVDLASARSVARDACQATGPAAPLYPGAPALLAGEILSGSLPVTYTWAYGDGSDLLGGVALSPTFTVTHSYTATGVYTVVLTAWNTCTLTPTTATARLTVTARPCLTLTGLSLVYSPAQVYTYTPVLFSAEVVTGSLPATYTWAFGDGSLPLTGTAATPLLTATHTFTAPGAYTSTLTAWNACTLTPTQRALTLIVAPCAAIAQVAVGYQPPAPRVGQVLTFTASVTGGSPPLSLAWAFGDGGLATGTVVTHVYSQPLTYTLALTAATPCSQWVVTALVGIAPPLRLTFLPFTSRHYAAMPWPAHLGYGANIASADHVISLTVMGFDWAKGFVTWADAGTGPNYDWVAVDNQLHEFLPQVQHVLLRINGPTPPGVGMPPVSSSDLAAFHDFALALAAHVSDTWRVEGLQTIAYEIWNEPNLDYEWGGTPSAAQYTALLKQGYLGIKAGDTEALVVSAGLATTGGSAQDGPAELAEALALARRLYGAIEVAPDLTFLRNMYLHGAKGYFDALGSHPYGGPDAPDTPPTAATGPIYFRRAEEQHQVMLDNGDDSPLWATEFGWVLETACDLGEHEWMEVSEAQQAAYLAGAYAYADEHWPWMGPMFLFNLDFATVLWYAECDPMRWYSITYRENPYDPGNSPVLARPAFHTLREMPKYSAW
jgi:PKD repeat protein